MNRKIKFRVYDHVFKKMVEPDFVNKEGIGVYTDSNGVTATSRELMQFTGLIDKNGKEIYEGDIVRVMNLKNTKEAQREVITMNPFDMLLALAFYLKNGEPYEVIGNKFENPELLEK